MTDFDRSWDELLAACQGCKACPLAETRNHVVVWRGGLEKAKFIIIGEGPGAEEDAQGKPFVGRSGKLMDLMLQGLGFHDQDYHIMNIVKCRPPKNRAPSPEEIKACRPLLERQIGLVDCRFIVLCGATAFHAFTGRTEPISKVRGQFINQDGRLLMPTFHPAYLLRNGNMRGYFWDDFAKLKQKIADTEGYLQEEPPLVTQYRESQGHQEGL